MNRVLGILIVAVLLVALAAYAASPVYAFKQLKDAAAADDRDRLEALIDFPAVRENLKSQVDSAAVKLAREGSGVGHPIAMIIGRLGAAIGDRAVDQVVTPQGVAEMVTMGRAAHGGYKDKAKGDDKNSGGAANGAAANPPSTVVHYAYLTLDRFRVSIAPSDHPDEQIALLMDRHGLFSWRVEQIELKAPTTVDAKDLY
jgi:Protein of unknown function (DUF2939)